MIVSLTSLSSSTTNRTKTFIGILILCILCYLHQSSNSFITQYQDEILSEIFEDAATPGAGATIPNINRHQDLPTQPPLLHHEEDGGINYTPLRILAFGGSTTFGAKLDSRLDAYPYQIIPSSESSSTSSDDHHHHDNSQQHAMVLNLAQQATGSDYSSKCVQSMIRDGIQHQNDNRMTNNNILHHDNNNDDPTMLNSLPTFNVILIEYSINGMEDLDILIRRLHQAYPHAFFIYIHLWSPRMTIQNAQTGQRPRDVMNEPGLTFQERNEKMIQLVQDSSSTTTWKWDEDKLQESFRIQSRAHDYMKLVDGVVWSFPFDHDPSAMFTLFASDVHHLNEDGHAIVASGIRQILMDHGILSNEGIMNESTTTTSTRRVNQSNDGSTWGRGDQCYSWFETGISPLKHVGGKMRRFIKPNKYAHEISQMNNATITFENKASWVMPLSIQHMVWGDGYYPKTKVTLLHEQSQQGNDHGSNFMILNPVHPHEGMRSWHVTITSFIGDVPPGNTTIILECLEKATKPLRITSIVLCGDCD